MGESLARKATRVEGEVPKIHVASREHRGKKTPIAIRLDKFGLQVKTCKAFKGEHLIPRVNSALESGVITFQLLQDSRNGVVDGKAANKDYPHILLAVKSTQGAVNC